ncbi:MAG: hypothetical protein Satyrvirus18_7 [Satyrvirus sp.]|uniref:Uncharacterized protein n=1 Tax=Satyrvirus sp. TaxID=2487771 RepID=A0A3G5AE70_9VIRU|nr:MAG: hypothetical protein Satyrvirus18_7 [Satyrvirus sp.]
MKDKYIKIGNNTFNKYKINKILARNSFFYIWNPYILDITYNKINKTTTYVTFHPTGTSFGVSSPSEHINTTMDFKYKFESKEKLLKMVEYIQKECPNCEVENCIK